MTQQATTTQFHGTLRRNPANPRYFTDDSGRAIYLTGSHTWATLVDIKGEGDPDFDWLGFLDMAQAHGHNFMRLWTWDHPKYAPWTDDVVTFDPMPYERTGPGLALDGQPKFDLTRFNPVYFERLRQRVVEAGKRGIYVAVMFFEGWCLKWSVPTSDAWTSHPFNRQNNVNGVDGDANNDGKADVYALESRPEGSRVVEHQKSYIRKVIDTVNEFDNVLYEIINEVENSERGFQWQQHVVEFVHHYERGKPKQHPVGMTAEGGSQFNPVLFAGNADWISPGNGPNRAYRHDPPAADGSKVVVADTDHLWGHGGNYRWAWKSFLRGLNPIFMDPWGPVPGRTRPGYPGADLNRPGYPTYEPLRIALGQTRRFAERLDLNAMLPRSDFASSGYCLADPGAAYLVYVPDDDRVEVYLGIQPHLFAVEWFNVLTGESITGEPAKGGGTRHFVSPFGLDSILHLQK